MSRNDLIVRETKETIKWQKRSLYQSDKSGKHLSRQTQNISYSKGIVRPVHYKENPIFPTS